MSLIERIEQAEGPSRELDAEIALALNLYPFTQDLGYFEDPAMTCGDGATWAPPHYTSSIDAALMLVPEGCDRADHVWPDTEGGYCTYLWGKVSGAHSIVGKSRAATPALALAAAALKAKEADNGR